MRMQLPSSVSAEKGNIKNNNNNNNQVSSNMDNYNRNTGTSLNTVPPDSSSLDPRGSSYHGGGRQQGMGVHGADPAAIARAAPAGNREKGHQEDYAVFHGNDYVIAAQNNNNNTPRFASNEVGDHELRDLQIRMNFTSLDSNQSAATASLADGGAVGGYGFTGVESASNDPYPFAVTQLNVNNDGPMPHARVLSPPGASGGGDSFQRDNDNVLLHGPTSETHGGFDNSAQNKNGMLSSIGLPPSTCENSCEMLKTADAQTQDSFNKLCGVFSQVDALFALTRKFDQNPTPEQLAGIIFFSKSSQSEDYTKFVSYYESLLQVFPLEEFQDEIVQNYLTDYTTDAIPFLKALFRRIDSSKNQQQSC